MGNNFLHFSYLLSLADNSSRLHTNRDKIDKSVQNTLHFVSKHKNSLRNKVGTAWDDGGGAKEKHGKHRRCGIFAHESAAQVISEKDKDCKMRRE